MEYCIAKPSFPLSMFIKHYWTIENCIPQHQEHTQRIVPNGLLELLFYLGDKPVSYNKAGSVNENTLITGHLREFYDVKVKGRLSVFSILFKPHGLSMFFDFPLQEIYNQHVPLREILKHDAGELEMRLFEANSFRERIKTAENYFCKLLQRGKRRYDFKRVEHCIDAINRKRGMVTIEHLASTACYSRKQFERVFSDYVGTTPKQFLKTIRFQHAIKEKSKNSSLNLTELTYNCGYYDQSHMINEFQKLSGMTPKQFFAVCEPYSDYFE